MKLCECAATTCNIIKATVTRLLFVLLSAITTWRVVEAEEKPFWWLLHLTLVPLLIETLYTLCKRKGAEFKWFTPSYLCFLICTVPGIWILELDKWDRIQSKANATLSNASSTSIIGVNIPIPRWPADTWIQVLEQVLMLFLVISRWILPKGDISRDSLSQILLVYIALASDIIELFDLYEEPEVQNDYILFRLILVSWSLSLLQFTFVLASSKSRKSRSIAPIETPPNGVGVIDHSDRIEILGLMLTLVLQDVPFLCIRLFIVIHYNLLSNTLLFFAVKNALIIALQFYRLSIIVCGPEDEEGDGGAADGGRDQERGDVQKSD